MYITYPIKYVDTYLYLSLSFPQRKISGSHLYKVEFHWGFTTSKTYTVNISDVGTIEKEYDDTHSAEIRSSIKPEAVKAQIPPSLREQPY